MTRSTAALTADLLDAHERTHALVADYDDAELEQTWSQLQSPLAWDVGHIAAFEDLWLVHRAGGQPQLRPDLVAIYDACETPRENRGELPFLRGRDCLAYLKAVRTRTLELLERGDPGDGLLHEMVLRHEHQHHETMRQTLQIARLGSGGVAAESKAVPAGAVALTGLETVVVPAGRCRLGAPAEGFAYDNERPRHEVDLPAFGIGRAPVTNGAFLHFVEGLGYQRREWWTDEAWAWKEEYDITHPGGWTDDGREWRLHGLAPLEHSRPVVHVSWFEAAAFARAHGARLPSEGEWERAATWDEETHRQRAWPWGDESPSAARVNLDGRADGPSAPGMHPGGATPHGLLGMTGDVWEWTASSFAGYPGFHPHPYREYSEPFFGPRYRVLRGGSWASSSRVATPTHRNWDFPQRRQIFSGFRLAWDA